VPRILVADDNSNIQKMVGLALKDQGIEVVAVGNGEAAVRKISDIKPDLVLADVFMPVRNGYEVCEYVKTDATLSHIPVILLVGAFDPLDEQEAQRVGADGVLKKPFVPPDPLISMVKSALARAGVLAAKAPELEPVKAMDFLAPHAPTKARVPAESTPHEVPLAALESESFVDEVVARPEPVKIDAGAQPVAFGSLQDTTTEDDAAFLPPANSALATERDWRAPDTEADTEEEEIEQPTASWRREDAETLADGESKAPRKGRRSGGFEPTLSGNMPAEGWEPAEEKPQLHEVSARTQEAPVAAAVIHEEKPKVPAAAPFASDAWAAVIASGGEKKTSEETVTALEEVVPTTNQEQANPQAVASSSPEVIHSEPEKKPNSTAWFSSAPSPWDSEIQKANRLASAWDSGVATPAAVESTNGTGKVVELPAASEAVQAAIEEAALPAAAVEAIREEAAQVAEDAVHAAALPASAEITTASALDETGPSMEEMVAKVLAKMSPDVLQAVTREILKPVIEAMVKEEMKSKKS